MDEKYFDDLAVGMRAVSAEREVSAAEIRAFATEFDPQPFHLDEDAARRLRMNGLIASGWHTASLTMRLIVDGGFRFAGGTLGAGVDDLRWPAPVRPGDRLHIVSELIELRPSRSKPHQGIVRVRVTTLTQAGTVVQSMIANVMVPRRPEPRRDDPS